MSFNFLRRIKFAGQFVKLVQDPGNLDMVLAINDTMASIATEDQKKEVVESFKRSETGTRAIRERPRLGAPPVEALLQLPKNTFGYAYAAFLKEKNLNPYALNHLKESDDDFVYARIHVLETHDLWHVLTGFDTDVPGELGLQAFYLTQFEAQFALVLISSGFMGMVDDSKVSKKTMEEIVRGHLMGQKAHDLIGRDWKNYWERDLQELRAELGIFSHFPLLKSLPQEIGA